MALKARQLVGFLQCKSKWGTLHSQGSHWSIQILVEPPFKSPWPTANNYAHFPLSNYCVHHDEQINNTDCHRPCHLTKCTSFQIIRCIADASLPSLPLQQTINISDNIYTYVIFITNLSCIIIVNILPATIQET